MADSSSSSTNATITPPETKSWEDVADEEAAAEKQSEASSSADIKLDSLVVDESKQGRLGLTNPDDSSIEAVTSGDTPYTSAKRFEDLNLPPELLKGLYVEMKFEQPSKIQAISLPMILTPPYKNLIAQAHNGSGKTTCFVLGMLSRVDPNVREPQALCICPTRELAVQNMEVLLKMGKFTGITSELALPPDQANYIRDESIRIMKAIAKSSSDCQVLLFSATFDDDVKDFSSKIAGEIFKRQPNQMFVKKEELSLESVKQYKVHCPDELSKIMVIKDQILELGEKVGQTIAFVKSRNAASMLHQALVKLRYEVTTIQGALNIEDRDKIIKEFKEGLTQVLITTDVLARGFDQSQVNLVINFDLPVQYGRYSEPDNEVYLHRVGRAGRFGRKGAVFNLLCLDSDDMIMDKIEKHFNSQITEVAPWNSREAFEDALRRAGLL
ncbi:hypothetical protein SASPL_145576 [Salvia splendens]|uniref:RNA helicase n=1 Tax=Salvia splendens TaxID=180675 RepID=A0A8X8WHZ9_SALSN|nr:hypothetical protein SASPL_145576 [Salvia splendens]